MKIQKKFFTVCIFICIFALLCLAAEAATYSGECAAAAATDVTWQLNTITGVLEISGEGSTKAYSSSSYAPWYEYRDSIKQVVIEDGITLIGEYAFYGCSSLESVTIPESVLGISDYVFSECTSLKEVNSLEYIRFMGDQVFYGCSSLESVDFSDALVQVGDSIFYGCDKLPRHTVGDLIYIKSENNDYFYLYDTVSEAITSCTINENTRIIGETAFANCASLINVDIPSGVIAILGSFEAWCGAFSDCTSLQSVNIPNTVKHIGWVAFSGCTSLQDIVFPDGLKEISDYAFSDCTSLRSVNIPDSVTYLGRAFYGCSALTDLVIGSGVQELKQFTFWGSPLENITLSEGLVTLGDAFSPLSDIIDKFNIPESVLYITEWTFEVPALITEENGILYLRSGDNPYYCLYSAPDDITECEVNANTKVISSGVFAYHQQLRSVTLPEGLINIMQEAFANCESLESINIPSTVKDIGYEAFRGCTSLFNENDGLVYIGNGDNPYYCLYDTSATDITSCNINENTKIIATYAFGDCTKLGSVTIPSGVELICRSAFAECTSLKSVELPSGIEKISRTAFIRSGIESIEIPDSVTSIDYMAFYFCPYLKEVKLGSGLKNIGYGAFMGCGSLESIVIPDGAISIDSSFGNSINLESVTIPESVTEISSNAFLYCSNVVIRGVVDSFAEEFALENDIPFKYITYCENEENFILSDVRTAVPADAYLSVKATADTRIDDYVLTEYGDTDYASLSISLMQGNIEIQPTEKVKVSIAVPSGLDGKKCMVYRLESDGSFTDMDATYDNGYLVFETEHFSPYAVIESPTEPGDADGDGNVTVRDAALVLQYKANWDVEIELIAADADGDGSVTVRDAALILQYKANWDVTLGG